jgi:hypothetical protein
MGLAAESRHATFHLPRASECGWRRERRGITMSAPVALAADACAPAWASLPLRLAQRAFATLIEDVAHDASRHAEIHLARLRSQARRTLSALSADDQERIARWLALQFASRKAGEQARQWVARVDAALAAGIDALQASANEALSMRRGRDAAAA